MIIECRNCSSQWEINMGANLNGELISCPMCVNNEEEKEVKEK